MSKKSERDARIQKQRTAQPPPVQGTANAPGASDEKQADTPVGWSGKRLPRWFVRTGQGVALLVTLSCLSGMASLIVPPSVPVPDTLIPSIVPPVEIVNQSFLPIYKIDYACEFVSLQDQSGFAVPPSAPVPDAIKTKSILHAKEKVPVECVGGTNLSGIRIKSVEFRVSISYFHAGWPFRRHTEYRVRSDFDTQGRFLHWVVQ